MKRIALTVLAAFLTLSGVTLAQQSGEEKKGSSMQDMMGQMMQGEKSGEGGMGDMKGMMNMMGQMSKMMDQCSSMMESAQKKDGKTEQGQQK